VKNINTIFVALGILVATACASATNAAAQGVEAGVANPSAPGACHAAIARLQSVLNDALTHGRSLTSAPESVAAMLHHQPTRDSIAKAQRESLRRVEDSLATAWELRSEGKRSECVSMLEKDVLSVGRR
jgi:hypothetical protein